MKVPGLQEFVQKYNPGKLPINWHHKLFYDILENKVVMKNNKLTMNEFTLDGKVVKPETKKAVPTRINKNIITLAPRFHAKSQCFTINYPLWEIYRNPNIRIMIVSANEEIALSFNRAIMNHLENNQKLIEDFEYLVPQFQDKKKWGEKAIIVKRETMEKDPTVVAVGVGGKIISRRADIIIIDDLIDMDSARTKSSRNKTREWFENVLIPILEDDGRLIIAGTAWYRGDIYDTLWQESEFDIRMKLKGLIYDARYERDKQVRYIPYNILEWPYAQKAQDIFADDLLNRYQLYTALKKGTLWPDKWDFPKLMAKKRGGNMSMSSFLRQYLNEPTSEEEKVFKDTYLKKALDRGSQKSLLTNYDNMKPDFKNGFGHLIIAIGLDLAISKKSTADESAIAVWGLTEKRDRVLLWLDHGRWSPDETKQRVLDAYYNFKPVKVRVESVAFQDMMRQELGLDIPVEGFHTTSTKKFNEETGLAHISMLLEQERVVIPGSRGNKDYYNKVKQLLNDMGTYSYDQHAGDMLMASWFALDVLKDFDKKLRDNRGFFATPSLVEQMKHVRAAHRVVLLGYQPPVFKLAYNSLLYIFREVRLKQPFIEGNEPFMIMATRYDRSVAYIFQKETNQIVGKIEGDISSILFATLLEKAGRFFNNAQIVVDKFREGSAILLELSNRNYPNLLTMQPGDDNLPTYEEGFEINEKTLPLAIDYFRNMVDGLHIEIPDEQLVKEMGELISVEGSTLTMSFGEGQRIKTVATALWLLDNYENMEKQPEPSKRKKRIMQPRYRVFRR